MKNSVLTLWAFTVLIGQSCSSALYQLNTDGSNGGAVSAERSSRLDLPRDMSDPIIARVARGVDDGADPSPSPKFQHLILIVPCVLGVAIIVLIMVVVCYQMRKSGRSRCISNEWLIWCGLMKRERGPHTPDADNQRPEYDSVAVALVRTDEDETRRNAPSTAVPRYPGDPGDEESAVRLIHGQGIQKSPWTKVEEPGACPLETSPSSRQHTPTTASTSLTLTDDEEISPQPKAWKHRNGKPLKDTRFPYPNSPTEGTDESIGQTSSITGRAHGSQLDNIPENYIIDKRGSDDDVFPDENDNPVDNHDSGVGSEDLCAPEESLVSMVRKTGIRRKRVNASGDSILGGSRKSPSKYDSKVNSPNTKELEAAVTKVQNPPIMAEPLQRSHGGEGQSCLPGRNTKQHARMVDPDEESHRRGKQPQANNVANGSHLEDTSPVLPQEEQVHVGDTGTTTEGHFCQRRGCNCSGPYTDRITGKQFFGHTNVYVNVKCDKLDVGFVTDMQVGDRVINTPRHLPPTADRDSQSRPIDKNSKERQTR